MVQKKVPEFTKKIARLSYEDGFKVYFEDNSFVICRFSGTEPLLRIFAESKTAAEAREIICPLSEPEARIIAMVCVGVAMAIHTVPTGFASLPPVGPAMPVVAMA